MNYSLEKIRTLQACDTLLVRAHKKKQSLERKQRNLGETIDTFRRKIDEIGPDMEVTRLSLAAFTAAAMTLPEGKEKMNLVIRIKRLEARQAVLQQKALVYHVNALLAIEVDYAKLNSQVSVMEQYIHAVEMLRTALSPPVLSESQEPVVSEITPNEEVWQSVIEAFLHTTQATPRQMTDPIDDWPETENLRLHSSRSQSSAQAVNRILHSPWTVDRGLRTAFTG